MRTFLLDFVLAAVIGIAPAGLASASPAPEPVARLSLHPVATTQPSLRYKLLPDLTEQAPGNAATLYLIAAKLGPDAKDARELLDRATDYLELSSEQFPREKAEQVLAPFEYRLRQADLAAHRQEANWDWAFREEGANALLPYLNDLRGLANLWALEARLRINQGDWPAAARAIQDGLSMARHPGRPLPIGREYETTATGVCDVRERPQRPDPARSDGTGEVRGHVAERVG